MIIPFNSVEEMLTNKVVKDIKNCKKDTILLVGDINSGKTKVINALIDDAKRRKEPFVDGTLPYGSYRNIYNDTIYDLYYICLIINKILDYIKKNYLYDYHVDFTNYQLIINYFIDNINGMYMIGLYKDYDNLYSDYFNEPEKLLEHFVRDLAIIFDYKELTLIIDNFDKEGYSSSRYQKLIYNKMRNYFKLIATVSDNNVISNRRALKKLSEDADIVKVNYSKNIKYVSDILNYVYINKYINVLPDKSIYKILSKEDVKILINYANGNIIEIIKVIEQLYNNMMGDKNINVTNFIVNFINSKNNDELIYGNLYPKRKLHI